MESVLSPSSAFAYKQTLSTSQCSIMTYHFFILHILYLKMLMFLEVTFKTKCVNTILVIDIGIDLFTSFFLARSPDKDGYISIALVLLESLDELSTQNVFSI